MRSAQQNTSALTKPPRRILRTRRQQDRAFSLLLLMPAIFACIVFILLPIINCVAMSFTNYKILNMTKGIPGTWNNFANYTRLFKSGKLQASIGTTFFFVFVTVALTFTVSMTLALLLDSKIRGARFLHSVMMIPWVIPTVISGLLWAWIFANPYGLFQYLVGVFTGGRVQNFGMLNNEKTAKKPPCGV